MSLLDWIKKLFFGKQEGIQPISAERIAKVIAAAEKHNATTDFKILIRTVAVSLPPEHRHLFETLIAQWALETGWGVSSLAVNDFNFGGMKWRTEMKGYAKPKEYMAHDGLDNYCSFDNIQAFITGYFRFLDRTPYEGWRQTKTAKSFRSHIAETWAPYQSYQIKWENVLKRIEG